jgi:DNA-directed RNA polymerase subunit RPC12/RpoP
MLGAEKNMDRFRCAECGEIFYFDMELEGMTAEPGEKIPLACPHCEHPWSYYSPDDLDQKPTLH